MKLHIDSREQETIDDALDHWEKQGLIDSGTAQKLRQSYEVRGFDWRRFAQYSFWVALSCVVLAFLSLFIDADIIAVFSRLYETPNIVISVLCAFLAVVFYVLGYYQKKKYPHKRLSSESLMVLGVFATATCVGYLGKFINKPDGSYSLLFLVSIIVYTVLAIKLSSKTIWTFMLVALGIWFATETAYHSHWGFKFWGMNYPLRFSLFGAMLTAFAFWLQPRIKAVAPFRQLTYLIGIVYLMVSLWLLSLFGNYDDLDKWLKVRQYHILYWGLLSTVVSLALAWYGLKKNDAIAREFGITFVLINLYTRYFEYLWDNLNRALFFALLALSFWIIGRKAEKIWNASTKSP